MSECSFCHNKAVRTIDGYRYCKKCIDEDLKFLLMSREDKEKLLELYKKELEKYDELISLQKKLNKLRAKEVIKK